jgi:Ca2+-binding EF-hand superfamily protein
MFKKQFQNELKDKLIQKSSDKISQEACLVKMFKFFDSNDLGHVEFSQFMKSMEKLGFQYDEAQMREIFDQCDTDGSGTLNYKEFVCLFLGDEASSKGSVNQKLPDQKTI